MTTYYRADFPAHACDFRQILISERVYDLDSDGFISDAETIERIVERVTFEPGFGEILRKLTPSELSAAGISE